MRAARILLAASACLALATGCSGAQDDDHPSAASSSSPSADPSPSGPEVTPPENSDPGPLVIPKQDPASCPKIRAGIDAFNAGDLQGTVRRFQEALPIARSEAAEHPTRNNRLLLLAVEYYATLPPAQYPQAINSSPEFKRHQVVTLGLCRYGEAPSSGSPSAPGQIT